MKKVIKSDSLWDFRLKRNKNYSSGFYNFFISISNSKLLFKFEKEEKEKNPRFSTFKHFYDCQISHQNSIIRRQTIAKKGDFERLTRKNI
ncbi:hypothetical protein BpHYR1_037332 [Brachionus plicatilis]|uniref:Uncharacterized protein n=1 Tax=Brachionus plicatilis TaxID=10195 RepID=A0A3M7RTA9_BRAPC|nr:hypothetical protein BpHYR1_037332 [Brachionus plicatilis]